MIKHGRQRTQQWAEIAANTETNTAAEAAASTKAAAKTETAAEAEAGSDVKGYPVGQDG